MVSSLSRDAEVMGVRKRSVAPGNRSPHSHAAEWVSLTAFHSLRHHRNGIIHARIGRKKQEA